MISNLLSTKAALFLCLCGQQMSLTPFLALATTPSNNMIPVMSASNNPFHIRPLEETKDQEIVWRMLQEAAHESDIEQVKSNELLQPYAKEFGTKEGDVGVVAVGNRGNAMGAAWIRALGIRGFATSHLKDKDGFSELKSLPELAIACLPDHRGQGVGTSLLKALLQSARDQGYPGICLSCRGDNAALRLYERMGFVNVPGTEQTNNRVGSTSLTMQCMFDKAE